MEIAISSVSLAQITAHAASSADEVCGLVFGNDRAVTGVAACRNVAADPARRFELDPVALIAAHRAARGGAAQIIGHYHSHPSGLAAPSARDAADAMPDGMLWLIVGSAGVEGWRAVDHGVREGRFDPVTLVVVE